jgi:hypothetical protein
LQACSTGAVVAPAKRVADFIQGCLREFARRYIATCRGKAMLAGRRLLVISARRTSKCSGYAPLNLFDGDRLPAFFLQNVL